MVEEMWELTGYAAKTGKMAIADALPLDESKTVDSHVEMAVQVNGKVRGKMMIPAGIDEESM